MVADGRMVFGMGDYISREEVGKALTTAEPVNNGNIKYNRYPPSHDEVLKRISAIPAADVVERKQGKWLDVQDPLDIYVECECSLCHERYFKLSNSKDFRWIPFNYCPNCGARMVTYGQDET